MTKSYLGSKRVSLFNFSSLPVSCNLLSSKVAHIDEIIEIKPLVGSSAWKEIRIRAACDSFIFH